MHEIFKTHPHLSKCYQTSDGECFYEEGPANLHANSLKDKKITELINPKSAEEVEEGDESGIESMTKKEIIALALADFEVELSDKMKQAELVAAYKELAAKHAAGATMTKTTTKIVTQEDLDMNPHLVEQGMKVGDTLEIPATTPGE